MSHDSDQSKRQMEVLCTSHRKLEGCRSSREKRKAIVQSTQDQIDSHFELSGAVGSCTIQGKGGKETTFRHVYLRIVSGGEILTLISQYICMYNTQPDGTLFFLIFTYLSGRSHQNFRDYGSNVAICHFLKSETNKGDFRLYFDLVEKSCRGCHHSEILEKKILKP